MYNLTWANNTREYIQVPFPTYTKARQALRAYCRSMFVVDRKQHVSAKEAYEVLGVYIAKTQ